MSRIGKKPIEIPEGVKVEILEKEIKRQRTNGKNIVAKRLSNLLKEITKEQSLSGQSLSSKVVSMDTENGLYEKIYSDIELDSVILNQTAKITIIEFIIKKVKKNG